MIKKASTTKNDKGETLIKIEFPYDLDTLENVRKLVGRRYQVNGTYWTAPYFPETVRRLLGWGFSFTTDLVALLYDIKQRAMDIETNGVPGLKGTLRQFQMKGVTFAEQNNGRALIADEMGLGKTIQSIAWMQLHRDKIPVIIVVPASLKLNWKKEIEAWIPNPKTEILSGTKPWKTTGEILIINYDVLPKWLLQLQKLKPKVLITDECFPAGTQIKTPFGNKSIESLKEGDAVFNAIGIGKVEKIHEQSTTELIRLWLSNGNYIDVTPNHPFFTTEGWIHAINLINKRLLVMSDILNILPIDINTRIHEKNKGKMRVVQKGFPINSFKKEVLRDILLSEVEKYPSSCQENTSVRGKKKQAKYWNEKSPCQKSVVGKAVVSINENRQSIHSSGSDGENKIALEGIWSSVKEATTKRRKWENTSKSTTNPLGKLRTRMGSGIPDTDKAIKNISVSDQLQSRFSTSCIQDMDRNRWMDARRGKAETTRQEEGAIIIDIRVERIEVLQLSDRDKSSGCSVYNLQVSRHPSYYAEGVLVHNCHYYMNNSAQRTKAIKMLGKNIPHILALSGTPIVNRPIEAFNAINLINPDLFPNQWEYAHYFCGAKHNGFGWDFNGATHTKELHQRLVETIMIRRLKKDVLTELPDKVKSFVPVELSNNKEYRKAETNFIDYIRSTKGNLAAMKASYAQTLASIEGLKQLAAKGKMSQAIDWIRNFLDVDGKLVVFATHKFVIDILMTEFGEIAVKIDGSVSANERQKAVDDFQNKDKVRLFVGNIQAAGVGITLTASSNVVFLELPWTPAALVQAEDRIHRIGQKDTANIYFLLATGTIEEKIAALLDKKSKVLNSVLDGKDTDQDSLLSELINQYVEPALNFKN